MYGQEKSTEKLYINFDEDSKIYYWKETEMGEKIKRKTYVKNQYQNGNIDFYIEDLLFAHRPTKMIKKEIDPQEIISNNLLSPQEIKEHISKIQEKYPLGPKYPTTEFPTLYITEMSDNRVIFYEVRWQFYNE